MQRLCIRRAHPTIPDELSVLRQVHAPHCRVLATPHHQSFCAAQRSSRASRRQNRMGGDLSTSFTYNRTASAADRTDDPRRRTGRCRARVMEYCTQGRDCWLRYAPHL